MTWDSWTRRRRRPTSWWPRRTPHSVHAESSLAGGASPKQAEPYFRDLGCARLPRGHGPRRRADADEQRRRCVEGIRASSRQTTLNLQLSSAPPPPPGTTTGAAPGQAATPPPPRGQVAPPPPLGRPHRRRPRAQAATATTRPRRARPHRRSRRARPHRRPPAGPCPAAPTDRRLSSRRLRRPVVGLRRPGGPCDIHGSHPSDARPGQGADKGRRCRRRRMEARRPRRGPWADTGLWTAVPGAGRCRTLLRGAGGSRRAGAPRRPRGHGRGRQRRARARHRPDPPGGAAREASVRSCALPYPSDEFTVVARPRLAHRRVRLAVPEDLVPESVLAQLGPGAGFEDAFGDADGFSARQPGDLRARPPRAARIPPGRRR